MKQRSKRYLLGLALVLIVVIGIKIISSSASQVDTVDNAQLTLSEMSWDFGDVPMSIGIAIRSIALENKTDAPITLTKMETSCMCTTAQIVHADGLKSNVKSMVGHGGGTPNISETIQAGETVSLLVKFDPNAHGPNATGHITRTVILETNSRAQPEIKLTFTGNVVK